MNKQLSCSLLLNLLVVMDWIDTATSEYFYMTDVEINSHNQTPFQRHWSTILSQCRVLCFETDSGCNGVYFDEMNGRCELYRLNGFHNKVMRHDTETYPKVDNTGLWVFKYANEDGGWRLVLKRVFGDIDFSGATWEDMKMGISGNKNDYWIGLDQLRSLTVNGKDTLRLRFSKDNTEYVMTYEDFLVQSEDELYRYSVGSYTGNYFDCFSQQSNMSFKATGDVDEGVTDCESSNNNLPNWYNTADTNCFHFNWFGAMDDGTSVGVTCDPSSAQGMKGCLGMCSESNSNPLDYLIVEIQ